MDKNAVRIERRGTKLGYVPRESNEAVARLLAFGHGDALECRVLSVDRGTAPWEQVRVAIDVPTPASPRGRGRGPVARKRGRAPPRGGALPG